MQNQFETYLENVAQELSSLPVARRNDELKEMRQHLLNAATVNHEMGQTEDEAVHMALEQFGPPDELAHGIVWTWQREEQKRNRQASWKVVGVCAAFCLFEGVSYPHDIVHLLLMFVSVAVMVGWRHLPPKYVPKGWAFSRQPLPLTRRWAYVCGGTVYLLFCYMPHILWAHVLTRTLSFIMLLAVCCIRSWEQQRLETP